MINRERIYTGRLKYMYRIVMKKDDGNRSSKFLRVLCHTKFGFAESGAQCILGECGPLIVGRRQKCLNLSMQLKFTS